MNVSEITEGIDLFVKAATNFVGAIERNLDAFYRIKDKIRGRRQIESINSVLSLFPQIWFFNGVFASHFLHGTDDNNLVEQRNNSILSRFNEVLDNAELEFEKNAPKIMDLGSEVTLLFKQQIAFRRHLIERAVAGQTIDEKDIRAISKKLEALKPVEHKFKTLSLKFRDDSIRAVAAEHPEIGPEEVARRLDLWPPAVVENALRKNSDC